MSKQSLLNSRRNTKTNKQARPRRYFSTIVSAAPWILAGKTSSKENTRIVFALHTISHKNSMRLVDGMKRDLILFIVIKSITSQPMWLARQQKRRYCLLSSKKVRTRRWTRLLNCSTNDSCRGGPSVHGMLWAGSLLESMLRLSSRRIDGKSLGLPVAGKDYTRLKRRCSCSHNVLINCDKK